jgi:hypothetical protein
VVICRAHDLLDVREDYMRTRPFPAVIVIGVAVSSMYTCPQMGG